LIIPREPVTRMADLVNAARILDPADRIGFRWGHAELSRTVGGAQRIGGKKRQNIGQQQFLMLLLVINADLDEPGNFRPGREFPGEKRRQRIVDMRAISKHALARGPGEETAPRARLARTNALIIRVETVTEGLVKNAIIGK